jgi:hypothetical protein
MKKIYTIVVALFLSAIVFAQAPQKMSYQAVIRDASNNLVTSHSVGMKISILQGSATGTAVYTETQTPSTNANGLVSIVFGGGTGFSSIDWSTGSYFIQTESDPTGGTNYTITGISQLLSVPYALYAGKATQSFDLVYPDGFENAQTIMIDTNATYTVPNGKNLYVQNYTYRFKVDNDTLGMYNGGAVFIVGQNKTIKNNGQYPLCCFIVNSTISPIILNLRNGNYTVPNGKQLIVSGVNDTFGAGANIFINGIKFTNGEGFHPYIISAGTVLSGKGTIDGYLR